MGPDGAANAYSLKLAGVLAAMTIKFAQNEGERVAAAADCAQYWAAVAPALRHAPVSGFGSNGAARGAWLAENAAECARAAAAVAQARAADAAAALEYEVHAHWAAAHWCARPPTAWLAGHLASNVALPREEPVSAFRFFGDMVTRMPFL